MSYPKQLQRDKLDTIISNLMDSLQEIPEADKLESLSYTLLSISTLSFFKLKGPKYNRFMCIIGVLENTSKEFYRRLVLPYEHNQLSKNGDLKPLERYPYAKD